MLLVPCSLLYLTTVLPPIPPPASVVIIQSDAQVAFYISFTSTRDTTYTTSLSSSITPQSFSRPKWSRLTKPNGCWDEVLFVRRPINFFGSLIEGCKAIHWTHSDYTYHHRHRHRHLRHWNRAVNDKQINTLVSCPVYNTLNFISQPPKFHVIVWVWVHDSIMSVCHICGAAAWHVLLLCNQILSRPLHSWHRDIVTLPVVTTSN